MDWHKIDTELSIYESSLLIPDGQLKGVPAIIIKSPTDLTRIPKSGGCYWIWTNEPVLHSFHPNSKVFPTGFDGGEIVYNGISKDDIRGRIQRHLLGKVEEGMSGIGLDLLTFEYKGSHRKKAYSTDGKAPCIDGKRITTIEQLRQIGLSKEEKVFLDGCTHAVYFRNGINVTEEKHKKFVFKVYFLSNLKSYSYGDIVEKKWREINGIPKLCSYSKGR